MSEGNRTELAIYADCATHNFYDKQWDQERAHVWGFKAEGLHLSVSGQADLGELLSPGQRYKVTITRAEDDE